MIQMVEILTPLLTQLGVGGVAGLCVGFALKKLGKIAAFILGIFFIALQVLSWYGIISINYGAMEQWGKEIINNLGIAEGVYSSIIANMPFAASFLVGLAIGIKIG